MENKKSNVGCFDGMKFWLNVLDLYGNNSKKTIKDCLKEVGTELDVPKGFINSLVAKNDNDVLKHVSNFFDNVVIIDENNEELNDTIIKCREFIATV